MITPGYFPDKEEATGMGYRLGNGRFSLSGRRILSFNKEQPSAVLFPKRCFVLKMRDEMDLPFASL
jgi:hypothetical protein